MSPYLQLPEVLALTKVSESTLHRLIRRGDFPHPVKRRVGRFSKAWKRSSVNRWFEINGGIVGEEYLQARRENSRLLSDAPRRYESLKGKKFGFWSVTDFSEVKSGAAYWVCKCKCGTMRIVAASKLKSGRSKSCGCKPRCVNRECRTHHPLYPTWSQMRQRCYSKSHPQYSAHGAMGITICPTWEQDFWAFLQDMGPRPSRTILRRIDKSGPFTPDNCRWGSRGEKITH